MGINAVKVAEILGGERVLRHRIDSLADLQQAVAGGLPVESLDETVGYVTDSAKAATALRDRLVPRATRARRARLKVGESERVERVARLMAMAEEVWECRAEAQAFLTESHPMLDGMTPLEAAETELGARRVERLLMRLEYSLPA